MGSELQDQQRRVAIIDDQPDVRAIVRLLLERSGVEVGLEAADAEDALERIDPSSRGVVVLDQHLEGTLTGLEAAPLLKARAPGVTIVLFSALDLAAEAAAEPAVAAYVRKDRILDLPRVIARVAEESSPG
jgi:DNA-binding NtrC family response regulator